MNDQQRAAMQMALEALEAMLTHMGMDEDEWNKPTFDQAREAIIALREALAQSTNSCQNSTKLVETQPQGEPDSSSSGDSEPVAWMHWLFGPVQLFMNIDEAMLELERLNREYPVDGNARQMLPLYTAPQRREWVGLTEEEENELWESTDSDWELMKRTEAKLREKNA